MEQQAACNGPVHLITVCVDSDAGSRMSGRIYHRFSNPFEPMKPQPPVTMMLWGVNSSSAITYSIPSGIPRRREKTLLLVLNNPIWGSPINRFANALERIPIELHRIQFLRRKHIAHT